METLIFERSVQPVGKEKTFYFFLNNTKLYHYPQDYSVNEQKKPLLSFCF